MEETKYNGKTLKEVKALHEDVRVVQAGDVAFAGTCDFRPGRLNVVLGKENIKFVTKTMTIAGEEYSFQEVDGSMDEGIIVSASYG